MQIRLITFLLAPFYLSAQQTLTLPQAIELVKKQSVEAKIAENVRLNNYYQFLTYQTSLKPQLALVANFPNFSKDYFDVRQPDGSLQFISRIQNTTDVGLSFLQQIPQTGGYISANVNFTRFDDFARSTKTYNGIPINVRLVQPLFIENSLKWQRKIEPLKLEEAQKTYFFELEKLAQQTVNYFFDVLDAQESLKIAMSNQQNTELILEIEHKREKLGTTSREKILQIELQLLQAQQTFKKAAYDLKIANLNLKTLTNIREETPLKVISPIETPFLATAEDLAWEAARKNRPEYVAFVRRQLEAERDLAIARTERNQINLVASFGLNGAGNTLGDIYTNIKDQQRLNIGINVPILDWGRTKARINVAEANKNVIEYTIAQQENTLRKEISTLLNNQHLLQESLIIAQKMDNLAQERYQLALQQYQLGKLNFTDYNIALQEKDQAKRSFFYTLRTAWNVYFQLKLMTLLD